MKTATSSVSWLAKIRSFASRYGAEVAVAVEVVWGHVEQDPALRGEGLRVLKLEARGLADDRRVGGDLADEGGQGGPDVSGHGDRLTGGAPDVAEELGDGGLPVRTGDGDEPIGQQAPGQLELADHRNAATPSLGDRGRGAWHPGALDYAAHPLDDFRSIPIQENFDVVPR